MVEYNNPFEKGSDRYKLWEMLVERDIQAFIQQDWSMVAHDFIEDGFLGIGANGKSNPDSWQLKYPDLESYKNDWLAQAKIFANTSFKEDAETAIYQATNLRDIEIKGDKALLHKKFDGQITQTNGTIDIINWQTLYNCQKVDGQWKILGFTGYLPFPMGMKAESTKPLKNVPDGASQHATAGPYSPVLEINPQRLVVISGQAALNDAGEVIGDTIEAQTELTINNCLKQLSNGGCDLSNVFKVNIYLKNLDDWARMNEIYMKMIPEPRPVRTAVGTDLLMTMLVEIEMWAVKK
jgi:enamine deaminase RidA (YjgF/YER057c/UK114 family)